jgi:hypothetical protein
MLTRLQPASHFPGDFEKVAYPEKKKKKKQVTWSNVLVKT